MQECLLKIRKSENGWECIIGKISRRKNTLKHYATFLTMIYSDLVDIIRGKME